MSVAAVMVATSLASAPAHAGEAGAPHRDRPFVEGLHGFRLGYGYANLTEDQLALHSVLRSPHMFVLGYELTQRMYGGDWLNVITVQNVSVSGIEQSIFIPTASLLIGFEMRSKIQLGVGPNFNFLDQPSKVLHMIMAGGYTLENGDLFVPLHAYYIPDVDDQWRAGVTIGVNW